LNQYRRHSKTVRASAQEGLLFTETYRILSYILKKIEVADNEREFALSYNFNELLYYVEHQSRTSSWMDVSGFYNLACGVDPYFDRRLDSGHPAGTDLMLVDRRFWFLKHRETFRLAAGETRTLRLPLKIISMEIFVSAPLMIKITVAYFCGVVDGSQIRLEIDPREISFQGAVQKLTSSDGMRVWLTRGACVIRLPLASFRKVREPYLEIVYSREPSVAAASAS
jgi:hypothetical protein